MQPIILPPITEDPWVGSAPGNFDICLIGKYMVFVMVYMCIVFFCYCMIFISKDVDFIMVLQDFNLFFYMEEREAGGFVGTVYRFIRVCICIFCRCF